MSGPFDAVEGAATCSRSVQCYAPYEPKAFDWLQTLASAYAREFPGRDRSVWGSTQEPSEAKLRERRMLKAAFEAALETK